MSVESCTTVKCNKLWCVSVDFRMMVVAAMCGNSVFVTSSPASIAIRDVMPLFSASKRGRASEREQEARAARRKKEQEERGRRARACQRQLLGPGLSFACATRCNGQGRACSIKFTSQTPLVTQQHVADGDGPLRSLPDGVAQALLQALVLGVYAMFVGDVLSRKDSVKPELATPLFDCTRSCHTRGAGVISA